MQGNATPFDGQKAAQPEKLAVSKQTHTTEPYQKVLDGRKRPIRGLWIRGYRYYARIAVEDFKTGRKAVRRVPFYDFGALEVQAVYISGNVRNPFEHYMEAPAKNYGMDWTTEESRIESHPDDCGNRQAPHQGALCI